VPQHGCVMLADRAPLFGHLWHARVLSQFYGVRLHLQVDAREILAAVPQLIEGALAEFRQKDMAALAQNQAHADQLSINVHAVPSFEFEEHVNHARLGRTSAKHPSAASNNCARKSLNQPRWVFNGDSLHLHRPGCACHLSCV